MPGPGRGPPLVTEHRVTVAADDLARLDPRGADPSRLVRAAFDFLLDREPPSSILRAFDLSVIGRYFPGWEADVTARLASSGGAPGPLGGAGTAR